MKWIVVTAALVLCLGAYADSDYEETRASTSAPRIDVLNRKGSVEVIGWDKTEIRVEGRLGSKVKQVEFESHGDNAEIKVDAPKSGSGGAADLTIYVPRNASLDIKAISASVDVDDVSGRQLDIETISGSVGVKGAGGDIEIEGVSGSVKLEDLEAKDVIVEVTSASIRVSGSMEDLQAQSVSGGVTTDVDADSLEIESVSGSLSIGAENVEDAVMSTVSGGITFKGSLTPDGELEAQAISGGITVQFTKPAHGEYDLSSFSGSINCTLSPLDDLRKSGREMEFDFGDGDCEVTVESFSGSINVK